MKRRLSISSGRLLTHFYFRFAHNLSVHTLCWPVLVVNSVFCNSTNTVVRYIKAIFTPAPSKCAKTRHYKRKISFVFFSETKGTLNWGWDNPPYTLPCLLDVAIDPPPWGGQADSTVSWKSDGENGAVVESWEVSR